MSIDLRIEPKSTYLCITVAGTYEINEAKREFVKILDACRKHGLPKVLIDLRPLVVATPISIAERFDFTQSAVVKTIEYRARGRLHMTHAVFLGSDAHIDPGRFGEMVAANRGITIRATTSLAEALAWLGVEEAVEDNPQRTPLP
jgi:hypothetical protein